MFLVLFLKRTTHIRILAAEKLINRLIFFLFQKKKQKALFCFAEDRDNVQSSGKPPHGRLGCFAPKKRIVGEI
jgi:hypothetical protein